ncbi:MAG: LysM peptidoglycan-binding domain-containing protein [Pseudomonadota bacterium]
MNASAAQPRCIAAARLAVVLALVLATASTRAFAAFEPPASASSGAPAAPPAVTPAADDTLWPRPAELEKDIEFWRHVYTQVASDAGLIHDSRQLERVYATVRLPANRWSRAADREIDAAKRRYRALLNKLARDRSGPLDADETRVLAQFPADVSAATLRKAAAQVRFQRGQSDRFREGLRRSGVWLPYIHQQLRARKLPPALAVLPHVESSFDASVYSHAGAAGLWQITRATGRHYLRIDHVVDERLDPYRATEAALKILAQNHRATGTWPLAITAYNHGPAGLRKAVRKLGTNDIETVLRNYRSRRFGFASRNFYVAFLAAGDVVESAADYFGEFDVAPPAVRRQLTVDAYIPAAALAEALAVPLAELKALNPSLRRMVWEGDKRVPKGFALTLPRAEVDYAARLGTVPEDARFTEQVRDDAYTVRAGDTLSGIGKRFGLKASHIARVNNLRSRHRIRVGQVLRLPPADGGRSGPRQRAPEGSYVVVSGDTLSGIAGRHGVSESELAGLNRLSNRDRIYPGQILLLAAAEGD